MCPKRRALLLFAVLLLSLGLLPTQATAAPVQLEGAVCPPDTIVSTGEFHKGAIWKICMPSAGWNGELLLFGHGYQPPTRDLNFAPQEWGDTLLMPTLTGQGYAYAATTYRRNGLVVWDALKDNRELLRAFEQRYGRPERTYLAGQSLGGLIMTQLLERYPELADGALSLSGPVGSFREQITYWGNFRVLFDYFFPDALPGSVVDVPAELAANPDAYLVANVVPLLMDPANVPALLELIRLSGAPVDPSNLEASLGNTVVSLLWFSIVSAGDSQAVLGGSAFDNSGLVYDNPAVNLGVERFSADANAVAALKRLETSGRPKRPLVIMHTAADPIVPAWHVERYAAKLAPGMVENVVFIEPIARYGHVTFTPEEVLTGFSRLVTAVNAQDVAP